ncbi:hypothetical protein EVAR_20858_1 [Eumeta japonica]|uniref:Uncharacterized protein n=1 Tax=Eumeta variegata TaxID=151549 RepID=A0A4C1UDI1_EUMVA|nr:hypothetical protein EVAR_20858_1 [Eumeta japonica]
MPRARRAAAARAISAERICAARLRRPDSVAKPSRVFVTGIFHVQLSIVQTTVMSNRGRAGPPLFYGPPLHILTDVRAINPKEMPAEGTPLLLLIPPEPIPPTALTLAPAALRV